MTRQITLASATDERRLRSHWKGTTLVKHLMTARRALVVGALLGLVVGAPDASLAAGATSARATAATKARHAFAVLRRPRTKRDVMRAHVRSRTRRAHIAALNSRLVYDGGAAFRAYLVLDGTRLCMSFISARDGYAAGGCGDAAAVASGVVPLYGAAIKPTIALVAVAAVDGSSAAQLVPSIGTPIGLSITNNAIVRQLTAPATIVWKGPDGRSNSTVEIGPRTF